jgi:hypothetical protein
MTSASILYCTAVDTKCTFGCVTKGGDRGPVLSWTRRTTREEEKIPRRSCRVGGRFDRRKQGGKEGEDQYQDLASQGGGNRGLVALDGRHEGTEMRKRKSVKEWLTVSR